MGWESVRVCEKGWDKSEDEDGNEGDDEEGSWADESRQWEGSFCTEKGTGKGGRMKAERKRGRVNEKMRECKHAFVGGQRANARKKDGHRIANTTSYGHLNAGGKEGSEFMVLCHIATMLFFVPFSSRGWMRILTS